MLPDDFNFVVADLRIWCEDREVFQLSLGYEHPVKGIAMNNRQCGYVKGMGHFHGQGIDPVHIHLFNNEAFQISWKW